MSDGASPDKMRYLSIYFIEHITIPIYPNGCNVGGNLLIDNILA